MASRLSYALIIAGSVGVTLLGVELVSAVQETAAAMGGGAEPAAQRTASATPTGERAAAPVDAPREGVEESPETRKKGSKRGVKKKLDREERGFDEMKPQRQERLLDAAARLQMSPDQVLEHRRQKDNGTLLSGMQERREAFRDGLTDEELAARQEARQQRNESLDDKTRALLENRRQSRRRAMGLPTHAADERAAAQEQRGEEAPADELDWDDAGDDWAADTD